jgi:RNA polymerase sigma-70 factor (ECF subfamily)
MTRLLKVELEETAAEIAPVVQAAMKGDRAAMRELFDQQHPKIYNLIYGILGEREVASDLTQEVFLRAFRALPRLKEPGAFVGWLRRIAVNLCRDEMKRHRIPETPLQGIAWNVDTGNAPGRQIPDPSGDASEPVLADELHVQVRTAMASLSEDHRMVIILHHLDGMPVEEIAKITGCRVGTVKSRLARAREALRKRLAPYIEG